MHLRHTRTTQDVFLSHILLPERTPLLTSSLKRHFLYAFCSLTYLVANSTNFLVFGKLSKFSSVQPLLFPSCCSHCQMRFVFTLFTCQSLSGLLREVPSELAYLIQGLDLAGSLKNIPLLFFKKSIPEKRFEKGSLKDISLSNSYFHLASAYRGPAQSHPKYFSHSTWKLEPTHSV